MRVVPCRFFRKLIVAAQGLAFPLVCGDGEPGAARAAPPRPRFHGLCLTRQCLSPRLDSCRRLDGFSDATSMVGRCDCRPAPGHTLRLEPGRREVFSARPGPSGTEG